MCFFKKACKFEKKKNNFIVNLNDVINNFTVTQIKIYIINLHD